MPLKFVLPLVLTSTLAGPVAAQSITDVQSYLVQNATQQEIFLNRQLTAQAKLVAECTPGSDVSSFRARFKVWIEKNPTSTTRPAQFAISAALLDFCKQHKSKR